MFQRSRPDRGVLRIDANSVSAAALPERGRKIIEEMILPYMELVTLTAKEYQGRRSPLCRKRLDWRTDSRRRSFALRAEGGVRSNLHLQRKGFSRVGIILSYGEDLRALRFHRLKPVPQGPTVERQGERAQAGAPSPGEVNQDWEDVRSEMEPYLALFEPDRKAWTRSKHHSPRSANDYMSKYGP
jgi:hypothetical protein